MNNDTNINLNQAECIKSATNLRATHYTNVCTGRQYDVPNGTVDMIFGASGFLAVALCVVFIGYMIWRISRDY